jgi:hypothetical protein
MQRISGLLGLSPNELTMLQRDRNQQERQARIEQLSSGYGTSGQQAMARLGAQAGTALRAATLRGQEDPDITQARSLQEAMLEAQRSEGFANLDPLGQQERIYRSIAQTANQLNNPQMALQAAQQLAQISSQRAEGLYNSRKRNLELEKLGLEVEEMRDPGAAGDTPFSELSWRDKARRNGEVVAAMVRDQSGNLVPVSGMINEQGQLVASGMATPALQGQTFGAGQYMSTETAEKLALGQAEVGPESTRADRISAFRTSLGSGTADEERQQFLSHLAFSKGMQTAIQPLQELAAKGEDPGVAIGTTGGLVRFAGNLFSTMKSASSAFNVSVGRDTNGDNVPDQFFSPNQLADEYGEFISIPESLQDNAKQAAQYRAAVMQLVYTNARVLEPGARQLSDQDIRNSMTSLGVDAADPRTLVAVLMNNFQNASERVKNSVMSIQGIGETLGVDSRDAQLSVYGRDAMTQLNKLEENMGSTLEIFANPLPPAL